MAGRFLAAINRPLQSLECAYYLTGSKGPCVTIAEACRHQVGHLPNLAFHFVKIVYDLAELLK